MKTLVHITISLILTDLILAACVPLVGTSDGNGNATLQPQTTVREAQVQNVTVEVISASPPQVNAVVKGSLSESCATLAPSSVSYADNVFEIKVYAVSPTDRGCAQVTTPFETVIPLDVSSKPAGTYTVIANGVNQSRGIATPACRNICAYPVPQVLHSGRQLARSRKQALRRAGTPTSW